MHSGGLELTKLTDTRLKDNLIRYRDPTMCDRALYARSKYQATAYDET